MNGNFPLSGYEPKPYDVVAKTDINRRKIEDSLIKVLSALTSMTSAERQLWREKFVKMLKTIQCVWLLRNLLKKNPYHREVGDRRDTHNIPFTPGPMYHRQPPPQLSTHQTSHLERMHARHTTPIPYPSMSTAAPPGVEGAVCPTPIPSGVGGGGYVSSYYDEGRSSFPILPRGNSGVGDPSLNFQRREEKYQTRNPYVQVRHGVGSSHNMLSPSDGKADPPHRGGAATTPNDGLMSERRATLFEPDPIGSGNDQDGRQRHAGRASAFSLAGQASGTPRANRADLSAVEYTEFADLMVSHIPENESVHSTGSNQAHGSDTSSMRTLGSLGSSLPFDDANDQQQQAGPAATENLHARRGESTALTEEQLQIREMTDRMAQLQQTTRATMQQLQEQNVLLHSQLSVISHQAQRAEQRAIHVEGTFAMGGELLISNQGAEDWIVDAILSSDLEDPYLFWDVARNEWETPWQNQIRMRVFNYICTLLPSEVFTEVFLGDIKAIYNNVVSLGRLNADSQISHLRKEVSKCRKDSKSMIKWLDELYKMWAELSILKAPMDVASCRMHILECLDGISVYKDVCKDIRRHPRWSMKEIRSTLITEAEQHNDAYKSAGSYDKASKRAAKKARKKALRAQKDANEATDKALVAPGQKVFAANRQTQQAYPSSAPPDSGRKAEGENTEVEKRARLKNELCRTFLLGHCRRGDSCYRKHESLESLAKQKSSNGKDAAGYGHPDRNPKTDRYKGRQCNQFRTNGQCAFGDNCKFSHDVSAGKHTNMAVRRKFNPYSEIKESLKVGDCVVVIENHMVHCARGLVGQVHGTQGDRYLVQLHEEPNDETSIGQFVDCANTVGLLAHELIKVKDGAAEVMSKAHSMAFSATKVVRNNAQAYSLHALFDTGSNVMSTGNLDIIKPGTLTAYVNPAPTEGYGGVQVFASHWGIATLLIGSLREEVKMDYVEGSSCTIVAGAHFDDGDRFGFLGANKCLHLLDLTAGNPVTGAPLEFITQFPRIFDHRDLQACDVDFISCLERDSQKRPTHTLYPLPDSTFVWYGPKGHAMPAVTRSRDPVSVPSNDTVGDHSLNISNDSKSPSKSALVEQNKIDLSDRERNAINMMQLYHSKCGHRSVKSDMIMFEWQSGRKFPTSLVERMPRCAACDESRITNKPARKTRLIEVREVGEAISADIIVKMPRSLSGYLHVLNEHDIKSNFGRVVPLKTRSCDTHVIHFAKWLRNHTGRAATAIHMDAGELKTRAVVAYCTAAGTDVIVNLADVHSNQTIERRNRIIIEMSNAMLAHGHAPKFFWEFTVVQSNHNVNVYPAPTALRMVGRPRHDSNKVRPLSPFEQLMNDGEACDMASIWKEVHTPFCVCVAFLQPEQRASHDPPGFRAVYCSIMPRDHVNVVQYGHFVLRMSDWRVVRARTVKCEEGEMAFVSSMVKIPSDLAHESRSPSGGASKPAVAVKVKGEAKQDFKSDKLRLPKITPPDKYATGQMLMTTNGPAIVLGKYSDGDLKVRFPESAHEPQEHYTLSPRDVWLPSDYPEWVYDGDGKRVEGPTPTTSVKVAPPCIQLDDIALSMVVPEATTHSFKEDMEKNVRPEAERKDDGPASNLRSKRKVTMLAVSHMAQRVSMYGHRVACSRGLASMMRTWDPGGPRLAHYPLHAYALSAKRPNNVVPISFPFVPKWDDLTEMAASDVKALIPRHFHQTFSSPLRPFLEDAEISELQDCCNREVWGEPQAPPAGEPVIGLMWVYDVKSHEDGKLRKFRSRITLMGNQERHILDKLSAYAPVHMAITVRLLIVMHMHDSEVHFRKLDVKNAYINEYMKRKVWTRMPPGYVMYVVNGDVVFRDLKPGEKHPPGLALPLYKALYGGMECGRIFWEAFVDWHLNDGFQLIHEDRCYLHKRDFDNNHWIKFSFHVDDNAIAYKGQSMYDSYLKRLTSKFDIEEGPLTSHLGVNYHFDRAKGTVFIEQSAQILKVLTAFGMQNAKGASTPTMAGSQPCEEDFKDPPEEIFDMESLVGHASYLYMCTRPDIGHPLKVLSRYTKNFGKRHVSYAKVLLRYLSGTRKEGLRYGTGYPLYIQIFTDASHASDPDTRRSVTSIVVKMGGNTIYWKNSFTSIVSHSSTESELMALDVGATTMEMVRWLSQAMGGPIQGAIQLFVDNQGTIDISSNPVQSGRNLHVHARYYYVRDLVYESACVIEKIPSEIQVADVGCSYKGPGNFTTLREYLMNCARVVHDVNDNPVWEFQSSN